MKVQISAAKALGMVQIASLGTVKTLADALNFAGAALSPVIPVGVHYVVIQAKGAPVRWSDDTQPPTTTKGMRIQDGGELVYAGKIEDLKFIAESGTPELNIAYYRNA